MGDYALSIVGGAKYHHEKKDKLSDCICDNAFLL